MNWSTKDAVYRSILGAVYAAADGTGLRVQTVPDLRGVSVCGGWTEAYVLPSDGGYEVDMWHPQEDEAYRIVHTPDLDEAVEVAICEALPAEARAVWRAEWRALAASA